MIKAARFPLLKALAQSDFSCVPALGTPQVLDLARGDYIPKRNPFYRRALVLELTGESIGFRQRMRREVHKRKE